jgi:hypothetical protein
MDPNADTASNSGLGEVWKKAYVDLHVAYLAVLRLRHFRKGDDSSDAEPDMSLESPFGDLGGEYAREAVEKWRSVWERHESEDERVRIMGAALEAIRNHTDSWKAFEKICPEDLALSDRGIPLAESCMTETGAVRDAMQERAELLRKFKEKGAGPAPSVGKS